MRGVVLGFLAWLFRCWTWFKAFFDFLGWVRVPSLDEARVDPGVGEEQLRSNEGHRESAVAAFLSSIPEDTTRLEYALDDNSWKLSFSAKGEERGAFSFDEATYREFLAAVASSKVEYSGYFVVNISGGKDSSTRVEELLGALATNKTFTDVFFTCDNCPALRLAEPVANLLSKNDVVQYLSVRFTELLGKESAELLANGLHKNRALKSLDLGNAVDGEEMEVLFEPLKAPHTVLQRLKVVPKTGLGLEHLGVMLATNTSLKELTVFSWMWARDRTRSSDEAYMKGFSSLGQALRINRSLQILRCLVGNSMELKALVEPLMPTDDNPQPNTTLTSLWLFSNSGVGGKEGVDILVDLIRTNTSLLELYLFKIRELDDSCPDAVENVVAILEALKTNKSLKTASFAWCSGVGGYKVLGTMMDLLLENHHLTDIDLSYTPLERCGDAEYVYSALKKRKKMRLWDVVQGMANVNPKSGRVFLCGQPYAGKTTLRKSIKEVFQSQSLSKKKATCNKLQGLFKKPKEMKMKVVNDRTRGIEVDHMQCDSIGISIWDMAGQVDYHSFHELVVPNLSADGSCSLFMLICNPMEKDSIQKKSMSEIRSEIEFWLRFVASNTRRSWSYRPHVSIVMTHFDYWDKDIEFARCIEEVIEKLKSQFDQVLEFDHDKVIFKANGENILHASKVFDFMKAHLKQLLKKLPKTIKAYSEIEELVRKWNMEMSLKQPHDGHATSKLPILKWEEFSNDICNKVAELHDDDNELAKRKKEFVAISLNDGGHIMYHEEGGFVITNPHWFCHDIMGEFLHRCSQLDAKLEVISAYGTISIKSMKQILLDIIGSQGDESWPDQILGMMKKLHICYEQDANNIMIPSLLQVRCETLKWITKRGSSKLIYVGRKLACKDELQTMFSPGFFTRLQVSFFTKFQNSNVENSYELFQDVMKFIYHGIEVILEFDHVNIDILLRSEQSQDKMLEILENVIVMHIKDLLLNPTLGCPGVILVEHVLRPECVQELVNSQNRKNQSVSMEELELNIMTLGFDATHNWKQCGHLGVGCDKVKDLLGEKAWNRLLQRYFEDLQRYQSQMVHISNQHDSLICEGKVKSTTTSLIWQFPQRLIDLIQNQFSTHWKSEIGMKLDNMKEELKEKMNIIIKNQYDILQLQEDIKKMQHNLLYEVSSRIDALMAFSVRMQQSQIPKLAYLTKTRKKKLLTHFVPGLMEFQLHLMCESRDRIHEVEGQQGCTVKFGNNETRTFITVLLWGLKIATILTKIGAHLAGGMGGMVPDFGEGLQLAGLILDTPGLLDRQMSLLSLESLPDDVKRNPNITIHDKSKAEEWLIKLLEPKCKEKSTFHDMFKLKKVEYKANHAIAWLCEDCVQGGMQKGILYNI